MAEDALDRLKKRTRSSVPPRDASLLDPKPNGAELGQPLPALSTKEAEPVASPTSSPQPNSAGLMRFCSEANITKEIFSEAAFRVCMQNPKFLHEVMQVAHQRYETQQHDALVQRQSQIQPHVAENDNSSMWLL
jgi:hypothetical protein